MKYGFIFHHGLGYDKSYWDNLLPFFEKFPCFAYDAGYYKNAHNPEEIIGNYPTDISWIGIGHSIGFVKLLQKNEQQKINLSGIVALQSFNNFLGNDSRIRKIRTIALDAIIEGFKKDPLFSLKQFIAGCDSSAVCAIAEKINNVNEVDMELFIHDFNMLRNKFHIPSTLPSLIIAGKKDPIVDTTLINDNFIQQLQDIKFINCDGHILGYVNAQDVYEIIMNFLKNDI